MYLKLHYVDPNVIYQINFLSEVKKRIIQFHLKIYHNFTAVKRHCNNSP